MGLSCAWELRVRDPMQITIRRRVHPPHRLLMSTACPSYAPTYSVPTVLEGLQGQAWASAGLRVQTLHLPLCAITSSLYEAKVFATHIYMSHHIISFATVGLYLRLDMQLYGCVRICDCMRNCLGMLVSVTVCVTVSVSLHVGLFVYLYMHVGSMLM